MSAFGVITDIAVSRAMYARNPKQTYRFPDFSTTPSGCAEDWKSEAAVGYGKRAFRLPDLWHPEGLYRVEVALRRREADIFQAAVAQVLEFGTDMTAPPTKEVGDHQFSKPQNVGS